MTNLEGVMWVYEGDAKPKVVKQPPMSKALIDLLAAYRALHPYIWVNEAGTVGDVRHKAESSDSYHLHTPPDAIDILAIGELNCRDLKQRMIAAKRFAALGAVCFHAANEGKQHLHVQVPGVYKRKCRWGEVNKR